MKKKRSVFKYIKFFLLLLFVFLLFFLKILSPFEFIAEKTLNPVSHFFYSLGTNLKVKYKEENDKDALQKKVKDLSNRLQKISVDKTEYEILKRENEVLRKHLSFLKENNYDYVLANLISRGDFASLNSKSQIITIDKGLKDGIKRGFAVLNQNGILVGEIFSAKESVSFAYLLNNPKCKIAVTVMGEDDTVGVIEGDLGLTIKMNFIPQSKNIKIGDQVITSGLQDFIPRGLSIGYISDLKKENNELWQSAVIESLVDFDSLTVVSVLKPKKDLLLKKEFLQ